MKLAGWVLALSVVAAAPAPAQYVSDVEKLLTAIEERDGATTGELVRTRGEAILNSRSVNGETPLMVAINARDDAFTLWLLQKGANPNYATGDGERPLIAAARIGYMDAIEWMLERKAQVDATNRMGETALIVAVQQRRGPIVERLLKAGANPDIADAAAGYSARDYAKRDSRSRQMLELIEAADAEPKAKKKVESIDDFKLK